MAVKWSSDLELGIEEIDVQHKNLITQVDKLLEACNQRQGKEAIEPTLNFLSQYVGEHFSDEEKVQTEWGYPGFNDHQKIHQKFIKDFSEVKEEFEKKGPSLTVTLALNRLLVDWLVNHIKKEDKKVAQHIKSKQD